MEPQTQMLAGLTHIVHSQPGMEQAGPSGGCKEAKAMPVCEPIKNLCSVVSSKNATFMPLSHPDSTKVTANLAR